MSFKGSFSMSLYGSSYRNKGFEISLALGPFLIILLGLMSLVFLCIFVKSD